MDYEALKKRAEELLGRPLPPPTEEEAWMDALKEVAERDKALARDLFRGRPRAAPLPRAAQRVEREAKRLRSKQQREARLRQFWGRLRAALFEREVSVALGQRQKAPSKGKILLALGGTALIFLFAVYLWWQNATPKKQTGPGLAQAVARNAGTPSEVSVVSRNTEPRAEQKAVPPSGDTPLPPSAASAKEGSKGMPPQAAGLPNPMPPVPEATGSVPPPPPPPPASAGQGGASGQEIAYNLVYEAKTGRPAVMEAAQAQGQAPPQGGATTQGEVPARSPSAVIFERGRDAPEPAQAEAPKRRREAAPQGLVTVWERPKTFLRTSPTAVFVDEKPGKTAEAEPGQALVDLYVAGRGKQSTRTASPPNAASAPTPSRAAASSPGPLFAQARPFSTGPLLATASSPPGSQRQAVPTPSAEAQKATAPLAPYRPGESITARLNYRVVVVEGGTSPVVLEGVDGSIWVGEGRLNALGRVEADLDTVYLRGQPYRVRAMVYDTDLAPGIQAQVREEAPSIAQDLLRASANAFAVYSEQLSKATEAVTIPGGGVAQSKKAPPFGVVLLGEVGKLFRLPAEKRAVVRVGEVAPGKVVKVVVLGPGGAARP